MKTKRQNSRIAAFQILYEMDTLSKNENNPLLKDFNELQNSMENHFEHFQTPKNAREFCKTLLKLYFQNQTEIDEKIQAAAKNWQIQRMSPIDRNILRLGTAELLYLNDTPPPIVLNEAIELAKEFGSEDSSKFINGVLDGLIQSSA